MQKSKVFILCTLIFSANLFGQSIKKVFHSDISQYNVEYGATFSEARNEIYFARSNQDWGTSGLISHIYYAKKENGKWSTPVLVSFSGVFDDSDPHLSQDGQRLYFISNRTSPIFKTKSSNIWYVKKERNNTWSDPIPLPYPINSERSEYSPKTDSAGNLYFASTRRNGHGQGDLYICRKNGSKFSKPENLGTPVNTDQGEWNLEINNDGNVLIFESSGREENLSPYGDLYISFKINNQWTNPQNITELNTTGSDLSVDLNENKEVLSYSSSKSLQSKKVKIYTVSITRILEKYRKSATLNKQ